MTKTHTPFLSLSSSGSVAGIVTSQKRGDATLLRTKPWPDDPQSLAQMYQRWDYQDQAYLWSLLTSAEKFTYQQSGVRYHLTGFAYWMKSRLADLPDIVARYRLDAISGNLALDSSRHLHHATIFGAVPTDGVIDRALTFDGIDDKGTIANHPDNYLHERALSIECFCRPHAGQIKSNGAIVGRSGQFEAVVHQNRRLMWWHHDGTTWRWIWGTATLNDLQYYHLCWTLAMSNGNSYLKMYIAGILDKESAVTGQPRYWDTPLTLGYYSLSELVKSDLDQIVIHNRVLDQIEVKRHAERRYPL